MSNGGLVWIAFQFITSCFSFWNCFLLCIQAQFPCGTMQQYKHIRKKHTAYNLRERSTKFLKYWNFKKFEGFFCLCFTAKSIQCNSRTQHKRLESYYTFTACYICGLLLKKCSYDLKKICTASDCARISPRKIYLWEHFCH